MPAGMRWAVLGFVVVVAVVAFVIVQPGAGTNQKSRPAASSTTPAPGPPSVTVLTVVHGKPAGGVKEITVAKGDRVRFTVRSDVADEVHVHGYDLIKKVPAGGSVGFDFSARIDGGFDVELENHSQQIAALKVQP